MNKRTIRTALPRMALWSLGLLVAFLPAFALSRGAQPGLGLAAHLRFGLSYGLSAPLSILPLGLLCLGLGALLGWLCYRKEWHFRLPEVLLAVFFSVNILIGLTQDRRITYLVALPGLDVFENILLWAGLLTAVSAVIRVGVR